MHGILIVRLSETNVPLHDYYRDSTTEAPTIYDVHLLQICSGTLLSIPNTLGTASSVLIKGGILISGVVLYSVLCTVAGTVHGVLIEGDVFILGYPYRGVPLYSH